MRCFQDNCVVNGRNSENEILNDCKNVDLPTQIRDLETRNNRTTNTEKHSGSKIENRETWKDAGSCAVTQDESRKPGKLKIETCSRKLGSKEDKWTEKGESNNEDICSGIFSTLNQNSSCDSTQVIRDKTSNIFDNAISQEELKVKDGDQTRAGKKVENAKVSDEPVQGKDISDDPSSRNSLRLITSSNKNKTMKALNDKNKSMQKRNVKFPEKMRPNISENASTRLRSRAVIKQPGHKNQYQKGHPAKGK